MSIVYVSGKILEGKRREFMKEVWGKIFELKKKYNTPIDLAHPVHTFYPRDNPTSGMYDFKIALGVVSSKQEAVDEFNRYARLIVNRYGLEEVTAEEF